MDWNHEVDKRRVCRANSGIRMRFSEIERVGGCHRQGPCCLGLRAHAHQHAAHVRVMNDRHRRFARCAYITRLHAVTRERHRALVRALANAYALQADTKTRKVHHDEHVLKTTIRFADDVAVCAACITELHDRCGGRMNAHLVFDRDAFGIVARTD